MNSYPNCARYLVPAMLATLLAAASSAASPPLTAVEAWLAQRAISLKSVQAGAGFEDLQPMKSVLKNVRVLGLGEASHGQREFFQFKHRMLEFLVTQMGYTAFSLEASYPACLAINDYVMYGKGDPAKALAGQGFNQFDTEEVLEMVQWMRAYNRALPENRRIKFLGYDMQVQFQSAIEAVTQYVGQVAPQHLPQVERALAPLKEQSGKPLPITTQTAPKRSESLARLNRLYLLLQSNRQAFVKQTSQWQFDVVLLQARVLEQVGSFRTAMTDAAHKARELKVSPPTLPEWVAAAGLRDVYMAENVLAQLKMLGPNARMIVGGHNGHVQLGPWGQGVPDLAQVKIAAMGGMLREQLGDAYYALGFDFYEGAFQANEQDKSGAQEFVLPPAAEGSLAWHLHKAASGRNIENFLLDLRGAPQQGPVAAWLSEPLGIAMLTGQFSRERTRPNSQALITLKDYFDGLLFVKQTQRSRSNPTS